MSNIKKINISNMKEIIQNNIFVFIYFSSGNCDVCKVLLPKVESMLEKYKEIKLVEVDIKLNPKIASIYSVYTIPTILLYIEGKETIREARFISILDLENRIDRYYKLV